MTSAAAVGGFSELVRAALRRRRIVFWTPVLAGLLVVLGIGAVWPSVSWLPHLGIELPAATVLAVFLVALVCEYVDSSLGMGYGTALTPILLMSGFELRDVVPCVLLSEFLTGLTAGLMHQRDGNMDVVRDPRARGAMLLLASLSGLAAIFAACVAVNINKFYLLAAIGLIITSMGIVILATLRRQLRYRAGHLIAVGAVAAFNKGLSGGGYGPLVTAGQVVSGMSPRQAVGITSLAESITCLVGLITYFQLSNHINWQLAAPLAAGALFSVPFATLTVRRVPERWTRAAVGVVTLILGLLTLGKLVMPGLPGA